MAFTPAQHTRIVLAEYKQVGVPFHLAWAGAMRTLPRKVPEYREWKKALAWARPAYEAYYSGMPLVVLGAERDATRLTCVHPLADELEAILR